jgi:hypothetical protein
MFVNIDTLGAPGSRIAVETVSCASAAAEMLARQRTQRQDAFGNLAGPEHN